MFGAVVMFDDEFVHIVSIAFTALILTELIMIALTVRTWHLAMIAAEILSLAIYLVSVIIFPESFGKLKKLNVTNYYSALESPIVLRHLIRIFHFRCTIYDGLVLCMESNCYNGSFMCSIIHSQTYSEKSCSKFLPKTDLIKST